MISRKILTLGENGFYVKPKVEMVKDKFSVDKPKLTKSLSAGAGLLVRLAVGFVTYGALAPASIASVAATAGLGTLCAETSAAFLENDGRIDKALKAAVSDRVLKATLRSALTAGVTRGLTDMVAEVGMSAAATQAALGATSGALTASVFGGDKAQAAMGGAIGGAVAEAFVELKSDLLGEAIALKAKNPGLSGADLQRELSAKFALDQRLARLAGSAVAVAVGADALSADASAHNAVNNNATAAIPYIAGFLGTSEGVAAIAALGLTGAAITAEAIKKSLPTIAKLYDDYLRGRDSGVAERETTGGAAPAKRGAANAPTSAAAAPGGMPEPDDGDGDKPEYKKSDFEKGDHIDLSRFTKRVSRSGQRARMEDPKTGDYLEVERALNSGAGSHGEGGTYKLFDKAGDRLGSFAADGKYFKP